VHHALKSLQFNNVDDVRVGRQVVLTLNATDEATARAEVTNMCEELLANTVIEDYEIEIIA
jgi:phosphoribosylformylglycinamidine synthase PurS subunit